MKRWIHASTDKYESKYVGTDDIVKYSKDIIFDGVSGAKLKDLIGHEGEVWYYLDSSLGYYELVPFRIEHTSHQDRDNNAFPASIREKWNVDGIDLANNEKVSFSQTDSDKDRIFYNADDVEMILENAFDLGD